MKTRTPYDLFFDQLYDLFSVETQLIAELPRLIRLTSHPALGDLLRRHSQQTEDQQDRLISLFEGTTRDIREDTSKGMKGLLKGGYSHLKKVPEPRTRDLMMIAHCLRIEHYEIAAYTITARIATRLHLAGEAEILRTILKEEKSAAKQLMDLEPQIFDLAMASGKFLM